MAGVPGFCRACGVNFTRDNVDQADLDAVNWICHSCKEKAEKHRAEAAAAAEIEKLAAMNRAAEAEALSRKRKTRARRR